MKVLFIRGTFLNRYEGQNYENLDKDIHVTGIGSFFPLHSQFTFPTRQFFSWYDLITLSQKMPLVGHFFSRGIKFVCNRLVGDAHFLIGFEKFVKKTGPYDIAHIAETHYGYGLQCKKLKEQGYIKHIVSTCWEIIPNNNETVKKKRELKNMVRNTIDYFICPTDLARRALVHEGVLAAKIDVIRVGVTIPPRENQRSSDSHTILFVGRLSPEKGILELFDAFKMLISKHSDTRLQIIGDGPLRRNIYSLIAKNKLHQHISITTTSYEHMTHYYKEADLVVIPSQTKLTIAEQYSMVAVEAMACGKAIVATPCGALKEVLGSVAEICRGESSTDIYQSLMKVLEDKSYRMILERKAYERCTQSFMIDKTRLQIAALYHTLHDPSEK